MIDIKSHSNKKSQSYSLIMVFVMFTIAGFAFLPLLNVNLEPSRFLPSITVSCFCNNLGSRTMENEVTSKIEGALNSITGITKITSVSSKNKSSVSISFDKESDMDQVRLDVATIIRRIYPKLSDGVSYPSIIQSRPDKRTQKSLLVYTLSGSVNGIELEKYAKNFIQKQVNQVSGIDNTHIYGATSNETQIIYKTDQINALHISVKEINQALSNFFNTDALGIIVEQQDGNEVSIAVDIQNICDSINWNIIPIKKIGTRIIYLTDIARIIEKKKEPESCFRINGEEAINIVIYSKSDANSIVTAKNAKSVINNICLSLPETYKLKLNYDSSIYLKDELSKIFNRTIITVFILLLFIFLVSLSYRYLLVTILSLIVNISLSFILYYLFGIDIHLYSLAGITISLGLIIDNTIVMSDHIRHFSNIRVFIPMLASTLTTIAALVFVVFLPESLRIDLWDFSMVIIINLVVSLVVALWFIPSILFFINIEPTKIVGSYKRSRRIVKISHFYLSIIGVLYKYRIITIVCFILILGLPVFLLPAKISKENFFANTYNKTLGNDWYVANAKPVIDKIMGGSLRLFNYYVYEKSYYTKPGNTTLYVSTEFPEETNIFQVNDVFMEFEKLLAEYDEIEQFTTNIYNNKYGEISITFKDDIGKGMFPHLLKSKLIGLSLNKGGISWNVYGIGKGFAQNSGTNEIVNYKIVLSGYNYQELNLYAQNIKEKLLTNSRVKNVNTSAGKYWLDSDKTYEYVFIPDSKKVVCYNTKLTDIYDIGSKFNINGNLNHLMIDGNNQIRLLSDKIENADLWAVFNTQSENDAVKLKNICKINKKIKQQQIIKENQSYLKFINYQYVGVSKFGNKHHKSIINEVNNELPLGYSVKTSDHRSSLENEKAEYEKIVVTIVILIFIICAVLFESLKQPLAIIIIIPLSFAGVFLSFFFFDLNFDQGGYASFILLSGIVVNAAIYLVNEYNNIRNNKNQSDIRCYVKAWNNKIIPISLTIISTVLGLIPFLLYGQNDVFWFALAAGTIGGLLYSFLIITLVLPLLLVGSAKSNK